MSPLNVLQLSQLDLDQLIEALASQPLAAQPGSRFYYGWSFDVRSEEVVVVVYVGRRKKGEGSRSVEAIQTIHSFLLCF